MAREQPAAARARAAAKRLFTRWLLPPALGWALLGYAALAVGSGWAYSTLRIRTDRIQTMRFERDRLRGVAIALKSGVGAILDDGVGAAVAAVNERAPSGALEAVTDRELELTLQKMLTRGEWVRSLFLTTGTRFVRAGRDGVEIGHTLPAGFPASDLSVPGDAWVGRPRPDPERAGALVVPIARRLHFAHNPPVWAGALINFQHFGTLRSQVGRPSGTMGLISNDGTLLLLVGPAVAGNPQLAPGSSVTSSPLFRQAPLSSESGVVEGFAPRIGAEMVVGYARVGDYPITTLIGEPVDSLLAPWRERTLATLIVTSASSVLVLVLTALLLQHFARRRRAEQELRESEGRYRSLVEALPEAVFVHRGGGLLFGNTAALKLIGARSAEELVGRSVMSLAVDSDRESLAERTRRIIEQGVAVARREARIRRLDGSLLWVEVEGVPIEYGGAAAVQSVLRDITARKLREEAEVERARRMERQSGELVSLASREAVSPGDLRGALRRICSRAAEVLEVDRAAVWLLDEDAAQLRCVNLYERSLRCHMQGFAVDTARIPNYLSVLRGERVVATPDLRGDARLQELAELDFPTPAAHSLIAAPVRGSSGLVGAAVFETVPAPRFWQEDEMSFAAGIADQVAHSLLDAQREQVLAELRALAGELMRSQDEERRRIGRELHDSTGQTLVALELDLARLERLAASLTPEERSLLAQCALLAHQCSTEIRTASYLLHPPLLDERGLISALRWLADGVHERGGIEVRLELPESMPRLPPEEELTLFRVAQETLTNVLRHSASPWVAIRLALTTDSLVLEVEDAGPGIAQPGPARAADRGPVVGVGLAGMRERLRQVGGAFELASTSGGTRIRATLPLRSWPDRRSA